jgi:hypothetical protein
MINHKHSISLIGQMIKHILVGKTVLWKSTRGTGQHDLASHYSGMIRRRVFDFFGWEFWQQIRILVRKIILSRLGKFSQKWREVPIYADLMFLEMSNVEWIMSILKYFSFVKGLYWAFTRNVRILGICAYTMVGFKSEFMWQTVTLHMFVYFWEYCVDHLKRCLTSSVATQLTSIPQK